MSFFQQIERRSDKSILCVGLDPRAKTAAEARAECFRIIDATLPHAACYKPNAAFFEAYGADGWTALSDVIAKINAAGVPVILDAKRGDIADTARAYATSAFEHLGASAITASPYMGFDSLLPFVKDAKNGVFVLCKTSNKGSNDLQIIPTANAGRTLYEVVAHTAETQWNKKNGNVGLVVGATDPHAVRRVREAAPSLWFLVPGVGAQGGSLEQALAAGLRRSITQGCALPSGMLINVSRGISGAKNPGQAAKKLNDEINATRARVAASFSSVSASLTDTKSADQVRLADALLRSQVVRFGSFKLKSGLMSPIYLDLRRLVTYPDVLHLIAREYARILDGVEFDRLCGIPYAALPIATAISLYMNKPLIYPRREGTKTYGTKAAIEGAYAAGERIVLIDDLVTTGETKIEAIDKLSSVGLKCVSMAVLIDREMGATKFLSERGYDFRYVVNLTQLLHMWRASGSITQLQFDQVREFMATTQPKPKSKL